MKVFLIIVGILILRMLLSRGKKSMDKQNDLAKKMIEQARRKREAESAANVRTIKQQLSGRTTTDDHESNFAYDNAAIGYATEEDSNSESAYQNTPEDILTSSEHQEVSHFKKNQGFTDSERQSQNVDEAAYQRGDSQEKKTNSLISLTPDSYRKFIIAKEIFDKPRSMR
ncbi:MAG TPA: hypothetical protein VFO76_11740 [Candidatus Kapabacteria bacterium]|nr:hypothetical protein [Candidatus Kapabacteria bacterium]